MAVNSGERIRRDFLLKSFSTIQAAEYAYPLPKLFNIIISNKSHYLSDTKAVSRR